MAQSYKTTPSSGKQNSLFKDSPSQYYDYKHPFDSKNSSPKQFMSGKRGSNSKLNSKIDVAKYISPESSPNRIANSNSDKVESNNLWISQNSLKVGSSQSQSKDPICFNEDLIQAKKNFIDRSVFDTKKGSLKHSPTVDLKYSKGQRSNNLFNQNTDIQNMVNL